MLNTNDIIRWCPDVSHCAFITMKLVRSEWKAVMVWRERTVIIVEDPKVIQKRAAPNTEEEYLGHQPSKCNIRH